MRFKYKKLLLSKIKKRDYRWFLEKAYQALLMAASVSLKKSLTGPVSAAIAVTWRCNSSCRMCDYPGRADESKEMSTSRLLDLIDQLVLLKTTGVTFYGGEPLLREDIFELIHHAAQKELITHLPTNGVLLGDRTQARELLKTGIDVIALSLDSATARGYRRIRGINGFDALMSGVENLIAGRSALRKKPWLFFIATLTGDNIDEAYSLLALARKCQVDGISFIPAQPVETLPNVMEGAFLKKLRRFFLYLYKEKKGGDSFIDNSREYLLYSLGRLDGRVP